MRSYLSLIPISAKVRRRQNRMTILCIILSVLLVTVIFSISDMFLRIESAELLEKHGNWHYQVQGLSREAAAEIAERDDVSAVGFRDTFNEDGDQPYFIGKKHAVLCGTDKTYMTELTNSLEEGQFPSEEQEVLLSPNAELALDAEIGDTVTLRTPAGEKNFVVSGIGTDDRQSYSSQTYLIAVYLTEDAYRDLMEENGVETESACYIQFTDAGAAAHGMEEIRQIYGLSGEAVSENAAVMGLAGESNLEGAKTIYGIAVILFVLVLLAGILMISGSLNSNVAQRTKFFGMLRCVGASRAQIIRLVRLEALNWCKTAVPLGVCLGTFLSWGICGWMKYGIGGEFASMTVFALSPVGILSGVLVGVATVVAAAEAPAKRAARVSPMAAVNGSIGAEAAGAGKPSLKNRAFRVGGTTDACQKREPQKNRTEKRCSVHRMYGKRYRIERTLGIHHAISSRKNWFLMTSSFALSIILFLCFSAGMDFARNMMPTMRAWQPDVELAGYANEMLMDRELADEIRELPGVKSVYGTSYTQGIPVVPSREGISQINLESYDEVLMNYASGSLVEGKMLDFNKVFESGNGEKNTSGKAMTVYNKDNPLKAGDRIKIGNKEVEIVCSVSESIYPSENLVICSQETFSWLTGQQNYSSICVQLDGGADEDTVRRIDSLAGENVIFTDFRESNRESNTTYLATQVIGYGFLAILGLITFFYIINSISMSVTARTRQYGAMRAAGMEGRQLSGMIAAEAFTYAVSGLAVGCCAGIPLSRFLYVKTVTRYFGLPWEFPGIQLAVILVFGAVSVLAAVHAPAKRICEMNITEAINEL